MLNTTHQHMRHSLYMLCREHPSTLCPCGNMSSDVIVFMCCFSKNQNAPRPSVQRKFFFFLLTFSVLVINPKNTTLHCGQSRSWSAEQGKDNKSKSLAAYPPHTVCMYVWSSHYSRAWINGVRLPILLVVS